ncbi:unnamed protein product [Adineta steineri]|uniref:ADP ribosyltransferase domain-containing protein n=1 Tax=Adineta steineri TaxID=433720 RepID=A0A815LL92_9BILA|nr:unnamed protein product [Adineta steineri]CAF1615858.1 unnamed protein product [Adineta steineri]
MFNNNEEKIPLKPNLTTNEENHQIVEYFNLETSIQTINCAHSFGDDVSLHVAICSGLNKPIPIYLTNNAFKSLKLTPYNQSQINEIQNIIEENYNFFDPSNNDNINWCLSGPDMIEKRKRFREQIDLYKTYDNQNHLITKLLIEITDYYLKEYLREYESFSDKTIKQIDQSFKQAIEEQNYIKYFIEIYSSPSNCFYKVLNKHLALYILDYFDINYSSPPEKYRLINCLVHIVTLLINHPDIHKHQYKGLVYRGVIMTINELEHYTIGNYILNRSFLSTSKTIDVALLFAEQNGNDNHDQSKASVLLTFKIQQTKTAIDIEKMSKISAEEEVLILPFSVFKVKDKTEYIENKNVNIQYEIELEECIDDDDDDDDEQVIPKQRISNFEK